MANTLTGETERFTNQTGVALPINSIVAIQGFSVQFRSQMAVLANAAVAGRLADGILDRATGAGAAGYLRRDFILEGTAAVPVNTAGDAVGDDVYLNPAVPGGWITTKPAASGQAIQKIGSVLTAHATLGRIRMNFQAGGHIGIEADFIDGPLLRDKPLYDVSQSGSGWFRLTGAVVEGELVTVGTRIYGFSAIPVLVPGADVIVNVSAGLGAAIAIPALVAAVNGDALRECEADTLGGDVAAFVAVKAGTAANPAFATNSVNGIVRAATGVGSHNANRQVYTQGGYPVTATDVANLATTLGTSEIVIGTWDSATEPRIVSVQAYRATGAAPNIAQAYVSLAASTLRMRRLNANRWALCYIEPPGGALLTAATFINWSLTIDPGTP